MKNPLKVGEETDHILDLKADESCIRNMLQVTLEWYSQSTEPTNALHPMTLQCDPNNFDLGIATA